MSWLTNLQNKPRAEKIRIMWIATSIAAVLLITVWIISAKYYKNIPKDKALFETIGKGIKDVRENYKK